MKKQRFDYSKSVIDSNEYHGFHKRGGRYHVDTKRLTKLGIAHYFPRALFDAPRNAHYFIPKKKKMADYSVNKLIYCLDCLTNDWHSEYKTAIEAIKTPTDVEKEKNVNNISASCDSESFEEAYVGATIDKALRLPKYQSVIRSMHLQYLQKMYIDYFRCIVVLLIDYGFDSNNNFDLRDVCAFIDKTSRDKNAIQKLPHYRYFSLLNHIDNFLKHNSKSAYDALADNPREDEKDIKAFLASYVFASIGGRTYEDGLYSGNWLKINDSFVDEMLNNLREFSKELCKLVFDEDYCEAVWNSDEALLTCLRNANEKESC